MDDLPNDRQPIVDLRAVISFIIVALVDFCSCDLTLKSIVNESILCLSPVLIYNTYPLNIPSTGIFHLTTSRLGYVEMLVEIEVRRTEMIEHGQAEKK